MSSLKDIAKKIALKNYKFMKTGEELPDVIQKLLGPEKDLKVLCYIQSLMMIASSANKKAADL